jgi:hypothetical protein
MAGSTFVFHNPRVERIVSGPGAIGKLAEEVERLGGKWSWFEWHGLGSNLDLST